MADVSTAPSGEDAYLLKQSLRDSTSRGVDSKEMMDAFLTAAHFGGKPKKAILPVPGVPPHLWHLHQEKKDRDAEAPQPTAKGSQVVTKHDNGGKILDTQPQPQKATMDHGTDADGGLKASRWSVMPKKPTPRVQQAEWPETKYVPPPIIPWAAQIGINQRKLPLGDSKEKKLPDLREDLKDGHHDKAKKPLVVKPASTPQNEQNNQTSNGPKIPHLYQSFISAESNKRLPVASQEAAVAVGQRGDDLGASRHLDIFRKTYKKRAQSVCSSQVSLDSCSTIRSYRATAADTKDTGAQPRSDIRGTIAPMHHLHDYGNMWIKVNWNAGRGENPDDDSIFCNPSFVSKFILSWLKDQDYEILVNLGVSNHWNSDIETDTGRFLMPVEMPETLINPASDVDEATAYRHQHMTSKMMSQQEMKGIDQRAQKGEQSARRVKWTPRAPLVSRHVPPTPTPKESTNVIHPAPVGVMGKHALGVRSNYSPSVPSYLRPAEKKDMDAVTRIYNREVTEGMQTLDSSPLSVGDFENILSTVEKLGMPFIVVVRGSARDLKHKRGNFEFSPFTQFAPYAHDPLDVKQNGAILGFAYLSVWEPGLAGDGNGSSRATARINLFVDPKFRRKKIGFSLLDKLISTVSNRFSSESGYDFVDLSNSLVYKYPLKHERKYFRLYLSYFVKHAHNTWNNEELDREQQSYGDDLVWVKKLLEEHFNFTEKVRFETTHRSSKHEDGRPMYWLDSVVFEHTCHLDARFTTDY